MKEKEVVKENEEEEEGISKFCDILTYTQTDMVQYENREHPPGARRRPRPSGSGGLGSITLQSNVLSHLIHPLKKYIFTSITIN